MLNSDRANRIFFFKQMGRFGPVSLLLQSCTLCIVQPPQSLPDLNLTISLFRAWRENQENRFFPGPWSPLAPLAQCEAASESSFAVKLGGQLWGGQGTRMTTSGRIRGTHLYSIQASPPGVAEYAVVPNGRTAREQEETGDRQDDPCSLAVLPSCRKKQVITKREGGLLQEKTGESRREQVIGRTTRAPNGWPASRI